ncbi:MAG: hypothetical protein WAZ27_02870 [Minisyncoccia bacterium]
MVGIALVALAEVFAEFSVSVGKYQVAHKRETLFAMGFLSALWATLFMAAIGFLGGSAFYFSLESLPTFLLRAVLEVFLMYITLHALIAADRTTFSFLRIITIPLLLATDLWIGYDVSMTEMTGISVIVVALVFLLLNHGLSRNGKLLSLASAILAVTTISLYKYDITHYNSVAAEQTLMNLIVLSAMALGGAVYAKENVFRYLLHPIYLAQSVAAGVASVLMSFGFAFGHPSVIMAAKRSFEIVVSIVSGRAYFHEKHILVKSISVSLIAGGIVLMLL